MKMEETGSNAQAHRVDENVLTEGGTDAGGSSSPNQDSSPPNLGQVNSSDLAPLQPATSKESEAAEELSPPDPTPSTSKEIDSSKPKSSKNPEENSDFEPSPSKKEKKGEMESASNSDSPHSLLIDEDEPGSISRVATEEPTNESEAYNNHDSLPPSEPAPPLEVNHPVEERENPYADVLKDPLLGQRPSNEVLQLLEQQSAEEKRLREQQEQKEREERARQEQVQINAQLNGLGPSASQALNGLQSGLHGLPQSSQALNGLVPGVSGLGQAGALSQAGLLSGLAQASQGLNGTGNGLPQANGQALNGLSQQASQALNGLGSQASQLMNGLTPQASQAFQALNGLTSQAQALNGLNPQASQALNGLTQALAQNSAINGQAFSQSLASQAQALGLTSQALNGLQNGQANNLSGQAQALQSLAAFNGLELPFGLFAAAGNLPLQLQNLQHAAQLAAAAIPAASSADKPAGGIGIAPNMASTTAIIGASNIPASISAALSGGGGKTSIAKCKPDRQSVPTKTKKEIYKWEGKDQHFAMAWSYKKFPDQKLRLACSTIKDKNNLFKNSMEIVEYDEELGDLVTVCHRYIGCPSVELHFIPDPDHTKPDLIASATAQLRIYSYHDEPKDLVLEAKLQSARGNQVSPLTGLDWNEVFTERIATCSIDSSCTIWDIEAQKAISELPPPFPADVQQRLKHKCITQMIAHDKPVHGIEWCKLNGGQHNFGTCSADGSARLFDLRDLSTSQIIYEDPEQGAVNHLAFNKIDETCWALVHHNSNHVIVGDHRMPNRVLQRFTKHSSPINSVDWAPHTNQHLCTGSSDCQALIWQIHYTSEPILAYPAAGEITKIRWSGIYSNWIAISFSNKIELLRV
ncbi:unnamed protein product [Bursaphelenchus okinawaensis]|uniref:WD_REPEATS_REGION domain-containing protein n=1 Tax=Bursaphelenchus okinawaensis TaxID=465554 RepID=A0A811LF44_9BILA|nr:unnamed protein product [Bursaphelenchus okinawaensis]CAG9121880.1 unnamed protein product [Bursaphelenchus okinawaensis]